MLTDTSRDRARWKDLTDEELMLRIQGGETDCYDLLVERYKIRLFNYLLRLTGNRDEAEEFAQEALVKAYIHADKYKTIAKFSTWLYTIATNLVRNRVRSRSRAPQIVSLWSRVFGDGEEERVIDIPDSQRNPEEAINDSELSDIIGAAIQQIPEKYRTSFVLREINEMSYEEIAAVTGLKLGTVRSRINRARNHFRQAIAPVLEKGIDF
ncbi:MAG TPA: sigma-70 family RNA polymerase sigma factor [Candidatus Krumholzibacteria bacterium]|nr:sigma-70 family RNA polymerase sigma factor [Candidatus Krumholzibacteria bacterium]